MSDCRSVSYLDDAGLEATSRAQVMVATDAAITNRHEPHLPHAHAHTDRFLLGESDEAIPQRFQAQLGSFLGLQLFDHAGEPGETCARFFVLQKARLR